MREKEVYIISGGSGFGKSKIIQEIGRLGFKTSKECAREIIKEQSLIDGEILPWKDIKAFQQEVLKRRIIFYESVGQGEIAFVDRGIPDQLAFAKYKGFKIPRILKESVHKYPYRKVVFLTTPWKNIYKTDSVRKENYHEACRLHEVICKIYDELGFEMVDIPQLEVKSRAHFVIDYVKNLKD